MLAATEDTSTDPNSNTQIIKKNESLGNTQKISQTHQNYIILTLGLWLYWVKCLHIEIHFRPLIFIFKIIRQITFK